VSKAQEFASHVAAVRKAESLGNASSALHDTNEWVARNADLIARALKTQEAFETTDCSSDFYQYELSYAVEKLTPLYQRPKEAFERGFQEGWRAYRQRLIADVSQALRKA
jgi:hypothetical protein